MSLLSIFRGILILSFFTPCCFTKYRHNASRKSTKYPRLGKNNFTTGRQIAAVAPEQHFLLKKNFPGPNGQIKKNRRTQTLSHQTPPLLLKKMILQNPQSIFHSKQSS
jgi:hypothetical protein